MVTLSCVPYSEATLGGEVAQPAKPWDVCIYVCTYVCRSTLSNRQILYAA